MRVNKYLAMLALGLGFCACSDDVDENINGGSQSNEKGTTYVAFSLDFKNVGSRATENATEAENSIKNAYVMLVNAQGNFTKVIGMDQKTPGNTGSDYYDATQNKYLMSVTPGEHTFYAVVNADIPPTTQTNVAAYLQSRATLNDHLSKIDQKGFLMASVTPLTQAVLDGVTVDQAKNGKENNFTIQVQRVSAKVTMTCDDPVLQGKDNTSVGGKIIPNGTRFMLMNRASESTRMVKTSFVEAENYTSPSNSTDEIEVYFKKGNETNLHTLATPAYCLENLHAKYVQNNTTYITLKTQFVPEKVVDCNSTTPATKHNPNIENGEYTAASFYVVTGGELTGNYILADDIAKKEGSQDPDPNQLPAGVTAISKIYTSGVCYFGPIWVGQETLNASQDAPITRNTWYNLKITKIVLPGSPTENKPKPDIPLEPETNVALTLEILPWNFVEKDLELQ